jgi:hypothetical protein
MCRCPAGRRGALSLSCGPLPGACCPKCSRSSLSSNRARATASNRHFFRTRTFPCKAACGGEPGVLRRIASQVVPVPELCNGKILDPSSPCSCTASSRSDDFAAELVPAPVCLRCQSCWKVRETWCRLTKSSAPASAELFRMAGCTALLAEEAARVLEALELMYSSMRRLTKVLAVAGEENRVTGWMAAEACQLAFVGAHLERFASNVI